MTASALAQPLLELLLNPLIFDDIISNLDLQSLLRLSRTSRSCRNFILETPRVFRRLDVSKSKGAYIPPTLSSIDHGGNSWRAERMDENLTEDEFYSGPLRGVLSKLWQLKVMQDVQVMILDGLASVTNDIIAEIATRQDYSVRMLSIRKCININQTKLQQFLRYICRPERPENTPRLQGVYLFTEPSLSKSFQHLADQVSSVTLTDGATLGALPADKSRDFAAADPWYAPTGRVVSAGYNTRSTWEETLMFCKGIIAFDAVLCSHMHHAMSTCLHEGSSDFLAQNKPGIPTIATVALGPEGCSGCGAAPEGTPVWGQSDISEFPLLSPPPFSGRIIDAVRPPFAYGTAHDKQRLIVSCSWCLANRHCDSCHRWWCADCYNPKKSKKLVDLELLSSAGLDSYLPSREELTAEPSADESHGQSVKVFNGFCVENCLVGEMMSGAGSYGMWA